MISLQTAPPLHEKLLTPYDTAHHCGIGPITGNHVEHRVVPYQAVPARIGFIDDIIPAGI